MAETWSDRENDAIVRDYFVMLEHEQMGQTFNKAEHRCVLMETTGRSHGSIEFKHLGLSLGGQDPVSLRHDYKTEVCRIPSQHADQLHLYQSG